MSDRQVDSQSDARAMLQQHPRCHHARSSEPMRQCRAQTRRRIRQHQALFGDGSPTRIIRQQSRADSDRDPVQQLSADVAASTERSADRHPVLSRRWRTRPSACCPVVPVRWLRFDSRKRPVSLARRCLPFAVQQLTVLSRVSRRGCTSRCRQTTLTNSVMVAAIIARRLFDIWSPPLEPMLRVPLAWPVSVCVLLSSSLSRLSSIRNSAF